MKKNKTVLGISSVMADDFDEDILKMQRESQVRDGNMMERKNELMKKEINMLKQKQRSLQKQLEAYRKVVFKQGDIHEILEMQHSKIFELETNLEVLQNKYERLLSRAGSSSETEYAIKCKELEKRLMQREVEHQKEIGSLKSKMMKMNASEMYQQSSRSTVLSANTISPLRTNKKFV